MKDCPTYSILPLGYEWSQLEVNSDDREYRHSSIRYINKRKLTFIPTLGNYDGSCGIISGQVKLLKFTKSNIEQKEYPEVFDIKHYLHWDIGRIYKKNSSIDFVFPLSKETLVSLSLRNINRNISSMGYETWAECSKGVIKIFSIPHKRALQRVIYNLLEKGLDYNQALKEVVRKSVYIFECDSIVKIPIKIKYIKKYFGKRKERKKKEKDLSKNAF